MTRGRPSDGPVTDTTEPTGEAADPPTVIATDVRAADRPDEVHQYPP